MSTQPAPHIPQWTLGDRLRKARSLTGLTTREFASEIGVSQKTVTTAENDHGGTRRTTIAAYAVRTGVPMEWLETGTAPDPGGPGAGQVHREGLEPSTRWLTDLRSHPRFRIGHGPLFETRRERRELTAA